MHIKSTLLSSPHAFSCRGGGVSELEHTKSLNLAFGRGDGDGTVLQNLKIFASEVGFDAEDVISLPQIHSNTVFEVGLSDRGKGYYIRDGILSGDGYVTDERGVVLGIKTADCTPILFEAVKNGEVVAVGAVHAGWRGCAAGILEKTVQSMTEAFGSQPADLLAAIGPCIGPCCFETDDDVADAMMAALGCETALSYLERHGSKWHVDLEGLNRQWLLRAGLVPEHIDPCGLCTACHPDLFWSHRKMGNARGAQIAMISLPEKTL